MRQEPVSIIVAAKNEEKNLPGLLKSLTKQKYPDYEIIIIDDGSVDDTASILTEAKTKYNNLKVIHLAAVGKKGALTAGIQEASNEILLFTDADCIPVSDFWIHETTAACTGTTEIVLGYGAYKKQKGLLNKLIRFDTVLIATQYFSLTLWKHPYMGVGRNLCYRKNLFKKSDGFKKHQNIQSGDDDLFIQEVATARNTEISLHPDSFTISEPAGSYGEWFRQKLRHHTTAPRYAKKTALFLLISGLAPIIYYITLIALVVSGNYLFAVVTYSFILLYQLFTFRPAVNKLGENDLAFFWPVLDIMYTFAILYIGIGSIFYSRTRWN